MFLISNLQPTLVRLPEPVVELGPELPPVGRVPAPRVRRPPDGGAMRVHLSSFFNGKKFAQKSTMSLSLLLVSRSFVRQMIYFLYG